MQTTSKSPKTIAGEEKTVVCHPDCFEIILPHAINLENKVTRYYYSDVVQIHLILPRLSWNPIIWVLLLVTDFYPYNWENKIRVVTRTPERTLQEREHTLNFTRRERRRFRRYLRIMSNRELIARVERKS